MPLSNSKAVIHIPSRDRDAARVFYRDTLGLVVQDENEHSTVFDLNGVELHLTGIPDHRPSPHPVLGPDLPDILAAVKGLAKLGLRCTIYPGFGQDELGIWTSADGKTRLAWFNDPDGNVLMLSQG